MNINFTLISQAMAFAIFIWFTVRFVWPPLMRAIENRQKTIAEGLAAGERGKRELELASQRSGDVVREAKQRASDIIAQAEKRAAEIVDEAKVAAREEGDRILVGAKAEVEQEVFRAKEVLRQQVAGLALAGAAKILRREVDEKAHAELLASLKAEL
ncbi:F-type H+-transporting ATPase subunit b [Nitrosospira multiformis ATCC 25196]|uniref:ATP synthase subunit b 1 n=2 Tax=Nitrosospira multiformis (strain ATCC 25196 / NCIMB 11849 / C 71) TaxID=323848 RepID=ATPF1_NITMU|nr:F0F1 ATP synthase subunit B [Nitrosospira multiformis]Q2YCA7.1 RecName: Full=ATP synthase subunit b 1; AltName: Full=ATP synthase F(0) sector subunit b 1; AltName: Full=ATPase subunit I 1; AltName: Full=F-type ATPase subunit b 1; Short=F-ATPase subunit b 1 [Nitrosospira multiformis ATCC 25196]ABB73614.1 ATP synthase F0, B subunit [Nitrosospira multiformis ATCC 25196]SEF38971.1 F-type H+-transporting ATPase subunit b [Nitrosospira multiformis ATCC 25196]